MRAIFESAALLGILFAGCTSDRDPVRSAQTFGGQAGQAGRASTLGGQATFGGQAGDSPSVVDYYADVLPILEHRCLGCHQKGGIAPIQFDTYASAKTNAVNMKAATAARIMPPWGATSDGSCGTFADSQALTDAEIATIGKWADGGAAEGTPTQVTLPPLPNLGDAKEYATPLFAPVAQGGQLAQFDEYRCFMLDTGVTGPTFITGHEVLPGTPAIIHHVLGFLVDPDATASNGTDTNLAVMTALDQQSPDRLGWPCFGMAGEGVNVAAVPVSWAPGQGPLTYPAQSGVPMLSRHKLVLQVHYNLADPAQVGKTDQTRVRLRLAATVSQVGIFALPDPFLRSLSSPNGPYSLPPGQASTQFSWTATIAELGLGSVPNLQLYGIAPHMHQRGQKFHASVGDPTVPANCAVDVQHWDFHWQHYYFYAEPRPVDATTAVSVTCDYDTSADTSPVLPGWGTRNEMCLVALYFTTPLTPAGGS